MNEVTICTKCHINPKFD